MKNARALFTVCILVAAPAIAERREPLPVPDPEHAALDTSSHDSLGKSLYQAQQALSVKARAAFDEAIRQYLRAHEQIDRGVTDDGSHHDMYLRVLQPFDGMTAEEILFELGRPTWLATRDSYRQLESGLSRMPNMLYRHGWIQANSEGAMFPPMSRVPGRLAPDLAWVTEEQLRFMQDPSPFVSPLLPDADDWLETLEEAGGFDPDLYEAALSEGFHYLSHAVTTEDEGRRFLAAYRLRAAEAVPGEVFLPNEFIPVAPAGTEALKPHLRQDAYAPLFIERPLYIGDPVRALYPRDDGWPSAEAVTVPHGTFPNTTEFMLGLEHLRDLDLKGRDPFGALGDAMVRFYEKNRWHWPRYSPTGPGAIFDASRIYPEFQSNPEIVVASNHPEAEALIERLRQAPRCEEGFVEPAILGEVGAASYFYLPHGGWTQSDFYPERFTFLFAMDEDERATHYGWRDLHLMSPMFDSRSIRSPRPEGAARLPLFTKPDKVPHALHIIALVIEDKRYPAHREAQPILMERPHADGAAVRVFYHDGVIEQVPFGYYPNTAKVIDSLEGFVAGK